MNLSTRMVISKRYTGLGDCLTSLLGAWRFARRTRRALVADWRFSCYATEPCRNLFGAIFATPTMLAGVPFLGDDRVGDLHPSGTFYMPEVWDGESMHKPPATSIRGNAAEVLALLRSGADTAEDVVVFEQCLAGGYASDDEAREFFSALQPLPVIAQHVEYFAAERFGGRRVIGVHVRHGNGGDIMGHARWWRRPADAMARLTRSVLECVQAVQRCTAEVPVLFLCTDSNAVEDYAHRHWPGVISRPKRFRAPGAGEMHLGPDAWRGVEDAVVEMFLLARCDVLIRYPESSFSALAYSLKRAEPAGLAWPGINAMPVPAARATRRAAAPGKHAVDPCPVHAGTGGMGAPPSERDCVYVSSRGILKSCEVHSATPVSSVPLLANYRFDDLRPGASVHVCTSALARFARRRHLLPCPIVLVSGDADESTPTEVFSCEADFLAFIDSPQIIHWFAQNAVLAHPKLSPLPIGIDYHTMARGESAWGPRLPPAAQERLLLAIARDAPPPAERWPKAYADFHFAMSARHGADRARAVDALPPGLVDYAPRRLLREEAWKAQAKHAFVISPHGNGLDCHRTWEALCLGCIPIVRKSPLDSLYADLPVFIVEDWGEVSANRLRDVFDQFQQRRFNRERLTLAYWMARIRAVQTGA